MFHGTDPGMSRGYKTSSLQEREKVLLFGFGYLGFVILCFILGFEPGEKIAGNFISFSIQMLKILPCAFILIGLFEVSLPLIVAGSMLLGNYLEEKQYQMSEGS